MTGLKYERGGGVVPIDILAAENGQTAAEGRQSLAELSAFGVVRLILGAEGDVPRLKSPRSLAILNEDGSNGCVMLFLDRPGTTLSPLKRRKLTEALAREPGLPLGSLAMLCALVRLANGVGVASCEALEDHLGLARGSMADKGKEGRVDP